MASLTDRKDGTTYYGRAPETIARRVWGRSAEVRERRHDRVGDDGYFGMVVKRDRYGTHVLADVVIRPEDAAD
ncbi:hypothetical protein AB0P05_26440 [Streptomyces flaveolus]|uniref:hypothetical protein n=1 Tax=Streptomyces flaveolus TaxID=67297 RepID=UPI0034313EA0